MCTWGGGRVRQSLRVLPPATQSCTLMEYFRCHLSAALKYRASFCPVPGVYIWLVRVKRDKHVMGRRGGWQQGVIILKHGTLH